MAMVSKVGQKIPLGVSSILGDSFSILFGNAFKVLGLVAVAAISDVVLSEFVFGHSAPSMWSQLLISELGQRAVTLASFMIDPLVYGLMIGLVMRLTYGAKRGLSYALGADFKSAWPAVFPMLATYLVYNVLAPINILAHGVSVVLFYAVFCIIASVAVLERPGVHSVVRSVALTKGYRLPIVGLFFVMDIALGFVSTMGNWIVNTAASVFDQRHDAVFAWIFNGALTTGLGFAFGGIITALIYARLRDIKEGGDPDHVAAVFD